MWSAHTTGDYHQVVDNLKGIPIEGDDAAVGHGHVEVAKKMALEAIDSSKGQDVAFSVSLSGHTSTKRSFSVTASVTAMQNGPDETPPIPPGTPPGPA